MSNIFDFLERRMPSLETVDEMLRNENDPRTRSTLLVLQQQITATTNLVRAIEDFRTRVNDQFTEHETYRKNHEERIEKHEELVTKAKTSMNWIAGIYGVLQVAIFGVASYMFNFLSNMRDDVYKLTVNQPLLEKQIDYLTGRVNDKVSDNIQEDNSNLKNSVESIKRKKVIRASK